MTIFSKSEKEELMSVVTRFMIFRFTDDEIIREIQKIFPDKGIISKPTLSRIKKEIRTKNMDYYDKLKKDQHFYLSLFLEKFRNTDNYIKEYYKFYNNEKISDILKLKILDKIFELDQYQLQMYMDIPYMESNHKQIRDELSRSDEEIKEADEQIKEDKKPSRPINPILKTIDPNRIPIESITKNKEIQEILMSRTQSGFEGRFSKNKNPT